MVNNIDYSNNSVTVTTEDGSVYTSNFVILSVSLGVLKSNLITYKPDLPVSILKVLDYVSGVTKNILLTINLFVFMFVKLIAPFPIHILNKI